jgi:misacylated tRNA(Ala) deacylase
MMTELLYQEDSYVNEFDATVVKAEGRSIILDKTHFYPASGGQPGDTGRFTAKGKEYKVLSAKKSGEDVAHEVDNEGMSAGDRVHATLDWDRRYRLMRGHTACHIPSYVVNKATGALITGNQIAEDKCRVDFDLENFDRERIKAFEQEANAIIAAAAPVSIRTLPRDEAFRIPSVMKLKNVLPPSVEMIRLVEICGHDTQACGGTHVRNTSEIKGITVIAAENKGKNNRRVYFVLKE